MNQTFLNIAPQVSAPPAGQQAVLVDAATWQWAVSWSYMIIAVLLIGFIAMVAYHFWQESRTPKESKNIKRCKIQGKPAILMGGDDGYGDILSSADFVHEGILETKPLGKNGDPWVGFLPRPVELDDLNVSAGKSKEKTKAVIDWLAKMASRKIYLRDAKIPIWLAYRGKTVLISLMGIVAKELLDELVALSPNAFVAIDLIAVKNWFDMPWDQTQRSAQGQRRENIGFKKGRKWNSQEGLKSLLGYLIVLFGILVVILVVVYLIGH